jgi:hypothetical protein
MTVTVKTNWHHQANKLAPKQVVRWVVYSVYIFIMTVTMKNKKSIKQMVFNTTPKHRNRVANVLERTYCLDKFSCKPEEDSDLIS